MPYLKIQTNQDITGVDKDEIRTRLSVLTAKNLGKPETYVMVRIEAAQPMLFAGDDAPCAFLELKSIGLPESKTEMLSKVLCQFLKDEFKIAPERVYIEFTDAKDSMWGWDSGTLA